MIIHSNCPYCHKIAREKCRSEYDKYTEVTLLCGHLVYEKKRSLTEYKFTSADGTMTAFPFQQADVQGIEKAGFRALLTYECGLGKTITTEFTFLNHPELAPILIVVKSAVLVQWIKQTLKIMGIVPMPLYNGKSIPIKGFPIHIISFDLCRKLAPKLAAFGFKTLVIDECQHIKDLRTSRTKAIQQIAESCDNIIALSATPIKNHAAEYFPILNMLRPTLFSIFDSFIRQHCVNIKAGYGWKVGGLRDPEHFKELTKGFIIHHTRDEVLPDLPKEKRNFFYLNIEDKALQAAYDETVDNFSAFMNEREGKMTLQDYSNVLEYLSKMRHITGLAKVDNTVDRAAEFLESTERKMVIFHHHVDVGDLIEAKLNAYCAENNLDWRPVRLYGGMKGTDLDQTVTCFLNSGVRIMLASTLAAGEGLNLQPCADAIQVERQWNSVNEEQAERRFSRPGATEKEINIDYMIAIGTVDDYLTNMVEHKRKIVKEATTGIVDIDLNQNSVLMELANALLAAGKPKWSL